LMTNLTCSTVSPTAYLPSSVTTNTHSLHSYHTGLDGVPLSTHSQPLTPDVQPAVTLPSPPVICTGDIDGTLIEDITVEDSTGATTSLPAPLPSSVTTSSHIVETTNSTQFISALENAIHQARLETDTSSQLPNNIKIICHQLNCHRSVGPIDKNILRCEALDVTLGNPEACDLISSWHVSDSPSLSDHSLMNFNINLKGNISHPSATSSRRRSIKRNSTDAASFQEHLADPITSYAKHLSAECNTVLELNDKTELINTIIHKASKLSSLCFLRCIAKETEITLVD